MPRYALSESLGGVQQALTTTYKSIVTVANPATPLRRAWLYDITVGQNGAYASTDTEVEWDISRQTAAAVGTAVTPVSLDSGDAAANSLGLANATTEGTITAVSSMLHLSINQRATYRWVAAPGSELVIPATASAGLAVRAKGEASGYVSTASASIMFIE